MHVQYSYDDRSIVVVNDTPRAVPGLKVRARVLNFGLAERLARETTVDLPADGVVRAFEIPVPAGLTPTYFLRLDLADATGGALSTNLYWLATEDDVLDFAKTQWFYTPVKQHANLGALSTLPATSLQVTTSAGAGSAGARRVRVTNTGKALALFGGAFAVAGSKGSQGGGDPGLLGGAVGDDLADHRRGGLGGGRREGAGAAGQADVAAARCCPCRGTTTTSRCCRANRVRSACPSARAPACRPRRWWRRRPGTRPR